MNELVTTVVEAFTSFVSGLGKGITSLFTGLLYQNNGTERVISDFAIYTMVILGITLGTTILFKVISLVRNRG